jgi:hypothetical protein
MGKYADEFKKSYGQGRRDTRTQLESVRADGEISHDYSHKIACQTMFVAILSAVLVGAYVWQFGGASLFIALIVAFGTWTAPAFLLTILFFLFFALQSKSWRLVPNRGAVQKAIPLAASENSQLSTNDPLSEQDQMYLFRCLAIVGSGSYALRGTDQEQITVLSSTLRQAKENGADWKRIYLAVCMGYYS